MSEQQGLMDIRLTLVLCEQSSPMLAWFISVMLKQTWAEPGLTFGLITSQ